VDRGPGADVVEGHEALVLVDLSGGKLPGDDAAEDAVHKHHFILKEEAHVGR
jgi:hypothetical protein